MSEERRRHLHIYGDTVRDEYRFITNEVSPDRNAGPGRNSKQSSEWVTREVDGGAYMLADFMGFPKDGKKSHQLKSYAEVRLFKNRTNDKDTKDKIWRVAKTYGYFAPNEKEAGSPLYHAVKSQQHIDGALVVLDDAGNGARDNASTDKAIRAIGENSIVVHEMSLPFQTTPRGKDKNLWVSAWQEAGAKSAGAYITIVSGDELRRSGLSISKRASWQLTRSDLLERVGVALASANRNAPILARMLGLDFEASKPVPGFTLVRFDCDAVAVVSENGEVNFYCDPGASEGDLDEFYPGLMVGKTSAFTARVARDVVGWTGQRPGLDVVSQWALRGLVASRIYTSQSFNKNAGQLLTSPDDTLVDLVATAVAGPKKGDQEPWERLPICLSDDGAPGDKSTDYLFKGESVLDGVPFARFGKLLTVDPGEIEGYRMIADLLRRHFADTTRKTPISIAVFGSPGGGKSYGVKQVTKQVAGDDAVILPYNVSQFGPRSLMLAMHQIRDEVLKRKHPICLFDEFDTADLAHLASFLAPMQDGTFEDDGQIRPIGPAVFVFIGGVFDSYEKMKSGVDAASRLGRDQAESPGGDKSPATDIDRATAERYRAAKLPDFASRLSGFVNVQGIDFSDTDGDPTESASNELRRLRRAIIMRQMFIDAAPALFDGDKKLSIDPGLSRAFLQVQKFAHGARSIEAIIRMSDIDRQSTHFPAAALPISSQLAQHVDADSFRKFLDK